MRETAAKNDRRATGRQIMTEAIDMLLAREDALRAVLKQPKPVGRTAEERHRVKQRAAQVEIPEVRQQLGVVMTYMKRHGWWPKVEKRRTP